MSAQKHLIVLGGPTASGKTAWAIRLALHFGTEIVSADSRQFYREMQIGTAKPGEEALQQVPHHFIDNLSIRDPYSVGDFEREALQLLDKLFERHDIVVLTGGSGLYIKALCEGLDNFPEVSPAVRKSVEDFFEAEGLEALQKEVRRIDPTYFAEVDIQNPARLMRALAVWRASGRPFSHFRRREGAARPFTPIYLQLHRPRAELYERINRRVDAMIEQGLVEEAGQLYPQRELTVLQTVGYREWFDYFDGRYPYEEAVRLIKRNTRRYAKRQLTWMRRDGHWKHVGPEEWTMALRYIELVREQGLRITQRPGNDPALTGLSHDWETQVPRLAACLETEEQVVGAIPLFKIKKTFWVLLPSWLPAYRQPHHTEVLLHEAIHCTEYASCFAGVEDSIEPFLRQMGFQDIEKIPAGADKILPASFHRKNPRILFRDGT
jgi:tRNA dimethylallyltransferase